jgi:protein TonB
VKFVVTETGAVTNIKVLKGHPLFDDVVKAAVATWTFEPAKYEGKPIAVYRVVKIPFRIKT